MADSVPGAQHSLLTTKWGPAPVWVWALGALALAWAYAKYQSNQAAATATTDTTSTDTTGDAQSQDVAPQFVIENNMPTSAAAPPAPPSAPVPTTPVTSTPVVTPPGTTTKPPTTSKPAPTPAKPPTKKAPVSYKVQHNDTLSSIATKYHVAGGWETLWKYNTTKGNRPADTIAELIKRGPNLLYSGETILIPQS